MKIYVVVINLSLLAMRYVHNRYHIATGRCFGLVLTHKYSYSYTCSYIHIIYIYDTYIALHADNSYIYVCL